jgi:hypothetical protein
MYVCVCVNPTTPPHHFFLVWSRAERLISEEEDVFDVFPVFLEMKLSG